MIKKLIKEPFCLPLRRLKPGIFKKKPLGHISGSGISEMFYQPLATKKQKLGPSFHSLFRVLQIFWFTL